MLLSGFKHHAAEAILHFPTEVQDKTYFNMLPELTIVSVSKLKYVGGNHE